MRGTQITSDELLALAVDDVAAAALRGIDFGPTGKLDKQAALGDFWIPQRGIFAIGRAFFADA